MTIQIAIVTLLTLTLAFGGLYAAIVVMPKRKLSKEWEQYVDGKVLETLEQFDKQPELTWANRLEMMQDTLADLAIELYKNVKNKSVRMPMMNYIDRIESKLVAV